jgi:hypothetical protein
VADSAILSIDLCAGEEIRLIGRHGRVLWFFAVNSSVQSFVSEHFLERHIRIGHSDWSSSCREVEINTRYERKYAQNKPNHQSFDHSSSPGTILKNMNR